ncbi:hypothetical protein [Parasphingopyxis marina]|nr:hypothetical protein [Parasphingopyxis marina]
MGYPLLWIAAAMAAGGVALLRLSWGRPKRSPTLNAAGWAALALAMIFGWSDSGAWGSSVTALVAMAAAGLALGLAGAQARPGKAPASNARVRMLPEGSEPRRLLGRSLTFLLVIVAGLFISIGLAVVVRGLAHAAGWGEANANAFALLMMPFLWAVLAYAILIQPRRKVQWAILLGSAAPVLLVLATGALR